MLISTPDNDAVAPAIPMMTIMATPGTDYIAPAASSIIMMAIPDSDGVALAIPVNLDDGDVNQ
ncbi:MAG: hypothetical protein ABJZ69_10610 [Hyphomicrobiales bacterium]